jgi:hypothetical protein
LEVILDIPFLLGQKLVNGRDGGFEIGTYNESPREGEYVGAASLQRPRKWMKITS